jgi:CheY-specific phosphatase CheX
MLPTDVQEIFLNSASEVFETMFFTGIGEENASEDERPALGAELLFKGDPSGRFGVRVPVETGRAIATSFLGLDEVSDDQVGEVVCELSNMLCGSVLSRIEAGARFELAHPEINLNTRWQDHAGVVSCTFGLEEGTVTMWLVLSDASPVQ